MIRFLADMFRGFQLVVGITAPPPNLTPAEERNFVLMWLGVILFTAGPARLLSISFCSNNFAVRHTSPAVRSAIVHE